MSFVIGAVESVRRKVSFEEFGDDGKKAVKCDFVVVLKVHDADTVKSRQKEMTDFWNHSRKEMQRLEKDPEYQPDLPEESYDDRYLREDIITLEGVLDADRKEIPFSDELLESVLKHRRARAALMKVWAEINIGDGARKGN